MSETVSRELMVLVEKVVRPLPIPLDRQKRVRNELLQHLQTIYAEELAFDGDSAKALARSQTRFGNPVELTAEIRRSIRRWECWQTWVQRILRQGSTESLLSYVARLTAVIICPMPLWIALMMTDHHFFGTVRYSLRDVGNAVATVASVSIWLSFLLMFAVQIGIEWGQPQRRWNRIACFSLAHLASWPISLMIMMLIADGSWSEYFTPFIGSLLLGGASVVCCGILGLRHRRDTLYCQQWAELDLESA